MKNIFLISVLSLLVVPFATFAQGKFFTREGTISFYSKASNEEIYAINKKVTSVIDAETGQMEFSVLMKAFEFEKALMQEHFNENYVESDKYPKAGFKGMITNKDAVKWTTDGSYPVNIAGKMTMHGVTKDITVDGKIDVKGGKISGNSVFTILLKDYDVIIPKLVADKVSESLKVTVDMKYDPFK